MGPNPSFSRKHLRTRTPQPVSLARSRAVHPWNVVHACEQARDVLTLVEGQLAVGMRPFLVTPAGFGSARSYLHRVDEERPERVDLLHMWNHVRHWRKLLTQTDTGSAEVLHAHSFAAGMAAVRSGSGVVYELSATVEQIAARNGHCSERSWLARSFRVAEQFVLQRAAAVVLHSQQLKTECIARGVAEQNIFVVPEAIGEEIFDIAPQHGLRQMITQGRSDAVVLLAPAFGAGAEAQGSGPDQSASEFHAWFGAFGALAQQRPELHVLCIAAESQHGVIRNAASAAGIGHALTLFTPEESDAALGIADVAVASASDLSQRAARAMAAGCPLIAADSPAHRDLTPEGRGCLWFRAGDLSDFLQRAAFLLAHPDFREALGASARNHMLETRSLEAVGERYDVVYRHAFLQRTDNRPQQPAMKLIPLQAGA